MEFESWLNCYGPSLYNRMWQHVQKIGKRGGKNARVLFYPSLDGIATCCALKACLEDRGTETGNLFFPITRIHSSFSMQRAVEAKPEAILFVGYSPMRSEAAAAKHAGARHLLSWNNNTHGKHSLGRRVENINPSDYFIGNEDYADDEVGTFPLALFSCSTLIDKHWRQRARTELQDAGVKCTREYENGSWSKSVEGRSQENGIKKMMEYEANNFPYVWMDIASCQFAGPVDCNSLQKKFRQSIGVSLDGRSMSDRTAEAIELYGNASIVNGLEIINSLYREKNYKTQNMREFRRTVEQSQLKARRADLGTKAEWSGFDIKKKDLGDVMVFPIGEGFDVIDCLADALYSMKDSETHACLFAYPVDSRAGKRIGFMLKTDRAIFDGTIFEGKEGMIALLNRELDKYTAESLELRKETGSHEKSSDNSHSYTLTGCCMPDNYGGVLSIVLNKYFEAKYNNLHGHPSMSPVVKARTLYELSFSPADFSDWFSAKKNGRTLESFG